jgi:hypothetical protein
MTCAADPSLDPDDGCREPEPAPERHPRHHATGTGRSSRPRRTESRPAKNTKPQTDLPARSVRIACVWSVGAGLPHWGCHPNGAVTG